MEDLWLIDEAGPTDEAALRGSILASQPKRWRRGKQSAPNLAVRVQDIIIHDNKKWFGEADIRLDALVIHGHGLANEPETFYMPQTFRFPRVADGDRLPIGEGGLLIFHGRPLHFLDVFLTVSRDRKDSDDLSALVSGQLGSADAQGAIGTIAALAVAAPQVAIITAAVGAAAKLGEFAYRLLSQVTGATVGLYRTSWLQHRDRFGLGRHPRDGKFDVKDLSFWYEIVEDKP